MWKVTGLKEILHHHIYLILSGNCSNNTEYAGDLHFVSVTLNRIL